MIALVDEDPAPVLVIDDDVGIGDTVVEILQLHGLPAEAVTTARAAIERAAAIDPAVALVDRSLPDMDGTDLCALLKRGDADLSLILFTGHASLESAIEAVPHIDQYLTKPVKPDDLVQAVSAARERSMLRRHNRELVTRVQLANLELETSITGLLAMAEAAASSGDLAELVDRTVVAAASAARAKRVALYLEGLPPDPGGVIMPLVAAGEEVGFLVFDRPEANEMYLGALAHQAAVAIQNMVRLQREREMVERMSDLSKMKSSFLATVSHELRTPLTAVFGIAQILEMPTEAAERERIHLAGRLVHHSERLRILIEDLLDASRMEFGGFRIDLAPVDVGEALSGVAETYASGPGHLTVAAVDEIPAVLADKSRLAQVLSNLVQNAQKYTPPDSHIDLGASAEGDTVAITVADDGPGIAPAFITRIFEPFSQEDDGDTRRDGGLGLGLYVSHGLVEAMGGTLEVASTVGIGTTFTVRLRQAASVTAASDGSGT